MALNLKNPEVESLAGEVAELTGESKTEAIRQALLERKERLAKPATAKLRRARVLAFLQEEVWAHAPKGELGKRLTPEAEDAILGYGPEGV